MSVGSVAGCVGPFAFFFGFGVSGAGAERSDAVGFLEVVVVLEVESSATY